MAVRTILVQHSRKIRGKIITRSPFHTGAFTQLGWKLTSNRTPNLVSRRATAPERGIYPASPWLHRQFTGPPTATTTLNPTELCAPLASRGPAIVSLTLLPEAIRCRDALVFKNRS